MGKYDIPMDILRLQEYCEKHPEIELRELRRLLYLVLDAVGEPVRIKTDLLVDTPAMCMFVQEDIHTNELLITVDRLSPIEPEVGNGDSSNEE